MHVHAHMHVRAHFLFFKTKRGCRDGSVGRSIYCLPLESTRSWFPATTSGSSQVPEYLDPGDQTPSFTCAGLSMLVVHAHTHRKTHKKIVKYLTLRLSSFLCEKSGWSQIEHIEIEHDYERVSRRRHRISVSTFLCFHLAGLCFCVWPPWCSFCSLCGIRSRVGET